MKILTISTMKGGVGKSTTTHALGEALAADGIRVLLIDIDPQSTLTLSCGLNDVEHGMVDVMREQVKVAPATIQLSPNLSIVPSDIELATVELELSGVIGRESVLARALKSAAKQYDLCLIDTPPSLGLLSVNALVCADGVLIPTMAQIADLRGLMLFTETLDKIKERLNPTLETVGILITMYNNRTLHHKEAVDALKNSGMSVLPVTIGRSIRVAESAAGYQSIVTYEPSNPRAQEYKQLAEVIKSWLEDGQK